MRFGCRKQAIQIDSGVILPRSIASAVLLGRVEALL
jgi:hypothetical protein